MGCPTSYDGMSATWSKGKLSRLSSGTLASGTTNYTYSYNGFGQRVSKTYSFLEGTNGLNPVQTGQVINYSKQYYYDHAGRLIAETINKSYYNASATVEHIVYLYDENSIVGIDYTSNGATYRYFFQRNLQGDVTAIFNTSGTLMAKYLYDAWGNCTISSETTNFALANANPIRYRGYYYDDDTGLYYCNARYYSPKWRRFISPDDTAYLDPESVNGLNLYCYCNNDPVNYADPRGRKAEWWQWLISGLEVAAGIALCFVPGAQAYGAALIGLGVGSIINGYITESNGGSFTAGWVGGQVAGAFALIPGIGWVAPAVGAFVGSVTTDWIDAGWHGIDWSKAIWSGVIAWGINIFPTMVGDIASSLGIYDPAVFFVNAYIAAFTSTASSIVNVFWRGKQK